ncbi:hypothetical protein Q5P01_025909 [Channa striata]|uniref:Uncharacterized protein n=1 Tax=Channa striata TaxID=64152 RepID=A0AA88ILL8_CHASR|nr:hypothetical protein Q5P01_025909 [Channa striata]
MQTCTSVNVEVQRLILLPYSGLQHGCHVHISLHCCAVHHAAVTETHYFQRASEQAERVESKPTATNTELSSKDFIGKREAILFAAEGLRKPG